MWKSALNTASFNRLYENNTNNIYIELSLEIEDFNFKSEVYLWQIG
jgi:hypothetical protein